MNRSPGLAAVHRFPWQVIGACIDRVGIVRIDGDRIEVAQIFVIFWRDACPMFSRILGAIHTIGGACYESVRLGRRLGNGADHEPFKANELPGVPGVGAAVDSASMRAECPTGGVKRVGGARIHDHGHDHIVVMLANAPKQFPVFTGIAGAKHVPVGSPEEQRARASGHRCKGLDIATGRPDLPPVLSIGRK